MGVPKVQYERLQWRLLQDCLGMNSKLTGNPGGHVDSLSFAGRENRASSTAAAQRLTAGLGMHLGRIFPDQLVGMVEVEFSTL